MAVLNRHTYKKIEYYFYNYFLLKNEAAEKEEEIIKSQGSSKDILKLDWATNKNKTDITAAKAMRLCELQEKEKWLRVIGAVIERYRDTEKLKLIEKKYFEGLSEVQICTELHVERRTYYIWRNEIVLFAAIIAVQEGVLKVA